MKIVKLLALASPQNRFKLVFVVSNFHALPPFDPGISLNQHIFDVSD